MDVILRVPVRRYVKKYIMAKFNLAEGQPWRISTRGKENTMLCSLLERTPYRYERYEKGEALLLIEVPSSINKAKGNFISQESITVFNHFILDILKDEITDYYFGLKNGQGLKKNERIVAAVYRDLKAEPRTVRMRASEGSKFYSRNESVYDILDKYKITNADLTFDSLVKHIQRSA